MNLWFVELSTIAYILDKYFVLCSRNIWNTSHFKFPIGNCTIVSSLSKSCCVGVYQTFSVPLEKTGFPCEICRFYILTGACVFQLIIGMTQKRKNIYLNMKLDYHSSGFPLLFILFLSSVYCAIIISVY